MSYVEIGLTFHSFHFTADRANQIPLTDRTAIVTYLEAIYAWLVSEIVSYSPDLADLQVTKISNPKHMPFFWIHASSIAMKYPHVQQHLLDNVKAMFPSQLDGKRFRVTVLHVTENTEEYLSGERNPFDPVGSL